jgi:hypothetical protein
MSIFDDLGIWLDSMNQTNVIVYAVVIVVGILVSLVSVVLLIPLDGIQAIPGVSVILAVSYMLAFMAWVIVMYFNRGAESVETVTWLNTHLMFLIILPTVLAATAMNVTAVQNTRNLVAAGCPK